MIEHASNLANRQSVNEYHSANEFDLFHFEHLKPPPDWACGQSGKALHNTRSDVLK